MVDLLIIGGGAAGFFGAIRAAELNPEANIVILEKTGRVLDKVRISGGGRCNVTHACFDPRELSKYYPRGERELLGPFNRFMCGDMMAWLDERGVATSIEDDGRVFPAENTSAAIIRCFENEVHQKGIKVERNSGMRSLEKVDSGWIVQTDEGAISTTAILIATGSSTVVWKTLKKLDIPVIDPVPSLFTFKISSPLLRGLMGLAVQHTVVTIPGTNLSEHGPTLVTHWGLSGPAILRLSAWGALRLAERNYDFNVLINWTMSSENEVRDWISERRKVDTKKAPVNTPFPEVPKRLWERMCELSSLVKKNWSDVSKVQAEQLIKMLCTCELPVKGKTTFKEEFVTAGGVDLKSVDFRTMESKQHPNLYFAGEVLNIDAITGGFNFQAAWTTSWIAAESWSAKH